MSRTKRDIIDTERMLLNLQDVLEKHFAGNLHDATCRADAEQLRRISMTLHRWHEIECGTDGGCIERGWYDRKACLFNQFDDGAPYWANHNGERTTYHKMPDREKGALARLARVMARYPSLTSYVQDDPRGAALYILRPGDVPAGEDVGAYYSRGLAVHQ